MNRIRIALVLLLVAVSAPVVHAADPLPPGALYRIGAYRMCLGQSIDAMALSANGKTLAAAGGTIVRAWDTESGGVLLTERDRASMPKNGRNFLALSPDGRQLALGEEDGTIRRWDISTGKELKEIELPLASKPCVALSYSPDGSRLLAGYDFGATPVGGFVIEWDLSGDRRKSQGIARGGPWCRYGPDGRAWMLGDEPVNGEYLLLSFDEFTTGKNRRQLASNGKLESVSFASDGLSVAISSPGKLDVYDVSRQSKEFVRIRTWTGEKPSQVMALCLAPKGEQIAVCLFRGRLCLWNRNDGGEQWTADFSVSEDQREKIHFLNMIAFSPDGKTVYAGDRDGVIHRWDAATGQDRIDKGHDVRVCAAARRGNLIVVALRDRSISVWDATSAKRVRIWQTGSSMESVAMTKSGVISQGGRCQLWDTATGRRLQQLPNAIEVLASADGGTFAIYEGPHGTISLFDGELGRLRARFEVPVLSSLVLAPDGQRIALGVLQEGISIWELDGRPRKLLTLQLDDANHVSCMSFSPNGRLLATGHDVGTIRIWNVATRSSRILSEVGEIRKCLAFSPDGLSLASGDFDGTVTIWDTETGTELRRFTGHQDEITQLHFARSIRTLLSVSKDRTALMWSLRPELPNQLPKPDALWVDLANRDAAKAYRAFWSCIEQPDCVDFLSRQLGWANSTTAISPCAKRRPKAWPNSARPWGRCCAASGDRQPRPRNANASPACSTPAARNGRQSNCGWHEPCRPWPRLVRPPRRRRCKSWRKAMMPPLRPPTPRPR